MWQMPRKSDEMSLRNGPPTEMYSREKAERRGAQVNTKEGS